MAINYYANIGMIGSDIEMNKNELKLPVIDNLATQPAVAASVEGQMYFDTTAGDKTMYFFNGTAWVEMDGSGSGVEKISATNGTFVEFNSGTNLVDAQGDVDFGTFDLAATGTPSGTNFLRGDNVWATPAGAYTSWSLQGDNATTVDITDGLKVDFTGGEGINTTVAAATPNTLTIDLDINKLTTAGVSTTDFIAFSDESETGDPTRKVSVANLVALADDTTYELKARGLAANSVAIDLDASTGTDTLVSINEAADDNISVASSSATSIQLGLQDDITIAGTLQVGSTGTFDTNVSIGGILTMSDEIAMGTNKITGLANGTNAADGVNLGQVEALVAGSSLFRGGYNANTGLTTDLGAGNGAINGASNIETKLGDFYAVTTAGTQIGVALEPGDLIFSNVAIAANSNPADSEFTIVQTGQSVATAASTDAGAVKGIAGFDSATFTVSGSGWVQSVIYSGTTNIGVVPTGGSSSTFLRGDGTWVTPTTIPDTGITGVTLATGTSSGAPLTESIASRELTLTSMEYAGTTNIGYVPTGGSGTTFLRGDGTWATPTDTQGVTSINASGEDELLGIDVKDGATASPEIGLDITGLSTIGVPDVDDVLPIFRETDSKNLNVSVANLISVHQTKTTYKQTLSAFTTGTTVAANAVVHGLNSFDVMVQLYDETSKKTIQAEVDRTSVDIVSVTGNSYPSSNITVLVSKIG